MAPVPVPESRPQTHPHTPKVLHCFTAGMGCESVWHVLLLAAAPEVVLPLLFVGPVCVVCSAGGTGALHSRDMPQFP